MSAAAGGILGGAIGGGLAVTVLAPLTAANNFLGSYFFGSGMILGERQMYQDDWIKIKERLDKGESFLVILEEVMKPNTQAVMQMAKETVMAIHPLWNEIVITYLKTLSKPMLDLLKSMGIDVVGIIEDKTPGEQEYADWVQDAIDNQDPVKPPSTPPKDPKEIEKTSIESVEKTEQQVKAITWQQIVPSGSNRKQVQAAVNIYEQQISKYQKAKNIFVKDDPHKWKLKIQKLDALINTLINTRKHYKDALSWLLKNYPKDTP